MPGDASQYAGMRPRPQGRAPARGLAKGPFRMLRRPGGPGVWGRFVGVGLSIQIATKT
ncbi:hypothetical protein CBM2633_A70601 [Cupriavidus taiwanensis]|nr:hypothetical protein CBM2633_A70601 [Cupriavidus taiwanensis]